MGATVGAPLGAAGAVLLAAGCRSMGGDAPGEAAALLSGTGFSTVRGVVRMTAVEGGVRVSVSLLDAPPGLHGVHVHEGGSCREPGAHWNPTRARHGLPGAVPDGAPIHAGDLGNIEVGPDGTGALDGFLAGASLGPGRHSMIGRAVAVKQFADDGSTQPDGDCGAALACGLVLEIER